MKDIREVFRRKLAEAVKDSGISYSDLSKQLGISKATMSMYVHGKALPSLETFTKLCDLLGESADFLLGRKDF